uniref:Uncharacterized protein n=1 Tax=Nelumbo nucifera TaxID=4432 RepID=A0A822YUF1_NELNU|nr:TPA_asm: hypothetical protein HUJ06_006942 [Nelumbo nucifera]
MIQRIAEEGEGGDKIELQSLPCFLHQIWIGCLF